MSISYPLRGTEEHRRKNLPLLGVPSRNNSFLDIQNTVPLHFLIERNEKAAYQIKIDLIP